MSDQDALLRELIEQTARLSVAGFAAAGGGNVSLRTADGIFLTGSGTDLAQLRPEDFCLLRTESDVWETSQGLKPSKEYPFHLGIYKKLPETVCILHFHPPELTAATTLLKDGENTMPVMIPYYLIRTEGTIQVPYAHPGTDELADSVVRAASRGRLILMRNHGATVHGRSISEAAAALETAEENARIFLMTGTKGTPLSDAACSELRNRYWSRMQTVHNG